MTPNLDLPTSPGGATNISTPYNEAMQLLDVLTNLVIVDKDLNADPATLVGDLGKCWIVGPAPTGDWTGHAGKIAVCTGVDLWTFLVPPAYIRAYVVDEAVDYRNIAGTWTII